MSEEDDLSAWGEAMDEQAQSDTQSDSSSDDPWGEALSEQARETESNNADEIDAASFAALEKSRGNGAEKVDLDVLLDIPVTLALEIGRAKVSIRNLLSYTQGSVIEMDRLAGEPLDLLVNGTLIAHGEVVVINDKFGVRLTDVISPQERIKKLK
ncbi:MAG: flagellar motor switch protein FliN [Piscirickettsiaceae bacterium CG_4_9_14_3_um_filter_43_564]|nr:flagellar motor switch protein FliN [Thiomicrospira sp.]OIP96136.1 MAG: flagellar motor switch protein FliN [Thiomicrospira sp. CG2_30_44_34]PIQ02672.1 MAG: flagellar motor switch protein FliN [Piscirickettsiaceae bacterium CG18_big_fil_WC_8_21_14_2_50_44_103]PIU38557.1 MAG: flagellar motor switch protein FliN [Piscirickettsiaceae bacterium CG07_land_8_20_14_0_80_44_28]PIW57658.1 MAG: flagellar motor switch protein FliN [Piscirickettsiaceae bacterium CG12_big_fil_rev_8_21_14_0_65_44_934]PIW